MELNELRSEIDRIDQELVQLFCRRMDVAAQIADYKKENNLPIFHPGREQEVLRKVGQLAGTDMESYTQMLYSMLFELSRSYQRKRGQLTSPLWKQICAAMDNTPKLFPKSPAVACLGAEGNSSRMACEKIFEHPNIMYCSDPEAVFSAIGQGICRYGIVPMEDPSAGSLTQVYDLMARYDFSIVRSCRLHDQDLAVNPHMKGNNLTRFICISRNPEIYPGADRTGMMMILPHKPGALYKVLARLYTLGINVTRMESRPIPNREAEFKVFFDLEASICSEEFLQLMCSLDDLCSEFKYLGSYIEVV